MNVANKSNALLSAFPVHPIITNTNVKITNEAIVIPDTGRFDVPIVPVKRPATITNNNDRIIETTAPVIAIAMLLEIKNPTTKANTAPTKSIIIDPLFFSAFSSLTGLAFNVSFIETIMVGISFIAPIIPPQKHHSCSYILNITS